MLFIPIGLGQKLFKVPIITILISIVCIFNYTIQLDNTPLDPLIMSSIDFKRSVANLYKEHCLANKEIDVQSCDAIKDQLHKEEDDNSKKIRKYQSELDLLKAQYTSAYKKLTKEEEREFIEKKQNLINRYNYKSLQEEYKKRKKDIKKNKEDESIKDILLNGNSYIPFNKLLNNDSPKLKNYKAYENYRIEKKKRDSVVKEYHISNNNLTSYNITFSSVINAIFSHGGALHLIGNLLALLVFGVYVEARMGMSHFVLSYLSTGTLGIVLYTIFNLGDNNILGASANIYAVLGAFYVLFFHQKFKFLLSFIVKSYTVELPVKTYFLGLYAITEFSLLNDNYDGIAHGAHAYGFLFGALYAYIWKSSSKIPRHFLYKEEFAQWRESTHKIETAKKILKFNSDNYTVHNFVIKHFIEKNIRKEKISHDEEVLYRSSLFKVIIRLIQDKKNDRVNKLLATLPQEIVPLDVFKEFTQKQLLTSIDSNIDSENYFISIIAINQFILKYKNLSNANSLIKTADSILGHLSNTNNKFIETLYKHNLEPELAKVIELTSAEKKEA